jgi:hypothetical protein
MIGRTREESKLNMGNEESPFLSLHLPPGSASSRGISFLSFIRFFSLETFSKGNKNATPSHQMSQGVFPFFRTLKDITRIE